MCPFAFTATPVTSPRYMFAGILIGSEPVKGITGTASWANAGDASTSDRAMSSRFMVSPPMDCGSAPGASITVPGRLLAVLLPRPDDLVELLALDLGIDLHPQREVVRQLERKRRLFQVGKQVLGAPGVEIEDSRLVREILRIVRIVQDLVVALVLREVGSVGLGLERRRHLQPLRGQRRELAGAVEVE